MSINRGNKRKMSEIRERLQLSQSKSDDNWAQDALDDSCEAFQLIREEVREVKMLRWKGFNVFADTYYDCLKLEKKEGSLD